MSSCERMIVKASDYTFTHFNHEGFGGNNKYIAEPKSSARTGRLFIKQDGVEAPCYNEFVYGRLLQAIGIPSLEYFLLDTDENDSLFQGTTPVGIEYMDGFQKFDLDMVKQNSILIKEYIECFVSHIMFDCLDDNIQLTFVPGKHIYTFDLQESFGIDNNAFHRMSHDDSDEAIEMGKRVLNAFSLQKFNSYAHLCEELMTSKFSLSKEEARLYVRKPMERLLNLPDECITEITDTLFEFYSATLAVFYEKYIEKLKKVIAAYLTHPN